MVFMGCGASLLEGKSRSLLSMQLCAKYIATSSPLQCRKIKESNSLRVKGLLYSYLLFACLPSRIRTPNWHLKTIYRLISRCRGAGYRVNVDWLCALQVFSVDCGQCYCTVPDRLLRKRGTECSTNAPRKIPPHTAQTSRWSEFHPTTCRKLLYPPLLLLPPFMC